MELEALTNSQLNAWEEKGWLTCEPVHEVLVSACKEVHGQVCGQAARDGLQEGRF